MKAIEILKLLLGLLPSIIAAVRAIEDMLPEGGKGAAKLALVRDVLQAGWGKGNDAVASFEDAWPSISGAVGAVVAFANATGIFRKK